MKTFICFPRMILAIASTPRPIGPAPRTSSDSISGRINWQRSIACPPVPMISNSKVASPAGKLLRHRKEYVFVNQLVLAVTTVAVEPHVPALLKALIGKSKPTGTALAAKIHQKNDTRCCHWNARIRPDRHHGARSLMSGSGGRTVKKLRPFRPAKSVGMDLQQELSWPRFRNCLLAKLNLFVPDKNGNPAIRWYGFCHANNECCCNLNFVRH